MSARSQSMQAARFAGPWTPGRSQTGRRSPARVTCQNAEARLPEAKDPEAEACCRTRYALVQRIGSEAKVTRFHHQVIFAIRPARRAGFSF